MKRKKFFLLFSFFVLVSFIVLDNLFVNSISLSSNIISIEEKNEIINGKSEYDGEVNLYYKGEKIPYISTDDYYLLSMKNKDDFYSDIINIDDFNIELISVSDKSFSIIAYNDIFYKILDVEVTSLPVVVMEEDNNSLVDVSTKMILFNPSEFDTMVDVYDVSYRLRGESSLINDKKSYRINVVDSASKKRNVSLLGMNYDDDWVLNSLSFDKSLVREKISYDIWNSISDSYQHQMEYVEVVIDNDYRGIYCLQEVVDLDTFVADEDDLLVFTKLWSDELWNSDLGDVNFKLDSSEVDEFEIEKGLYDNSLRLELLRSFKKSLDNLDSSIDIRYDFDNSVNYSLLVNLTLAFDNTYKNQKILFRDDGSYYTVIKTPWDLDYTFNNEVMSGFVSSSEWLSDTAVAEKIRMSDDFYNLTKEKYIKIRKSIYNEEYLNSLIDKYEAQLFDSGAIERNSKRWNNSFYGSAVIREFITERILFLDNYFGGVGNEL